MSAIAEAWPISISVRASYTGISRVAGYERRAASRVPGSEHAGGIDGVQQLARSGLGLADIVDDDVGPEMIARNVGTLHAIRDAAVAGAVACGEAGAEHVGGAVTSTATTLA